LFHPAPAAWNLSPMRPNWILEKKGSASGLNTAKATEK